MFSNTEQFSSATKALIESQLAVFNQLTNKTIEGLQKIVELNINAVKTSTEESLAVVQKMGDAKTPQAMLDLTTQQAKHSAEKAATYSRHFTEIATGLQSEFNKAAENQLQETKKKVEALIDDVTKHAPKGSESAVAMLKTAIHTANSSLEQITHATQHAVEAVEHQVIEATEQFAKAIEKSIPTKNTKK